MARIPGDDPVTPSGVRAMVVEDEVALAEVLGSYLEREGFEVHLRHDGQAAVASAREVDPDIVVLDLGLPGLDGIEVCRQLRTFSDAYVVMLTAREDEVDKLIGLSVGADDYMTKPFSPRELIAGVQALLRRPRHTRPLEASPDERVLRSFGPLAVDPLGRDVSPHGEPVSLTRAESDLLAALSEHPRMAFSRRQLIDGCGDRAGSATSTSSMSTSVTCGASSTTRPPPRSSSEPRGESAIGWGPANDPSDHRQQA